MMQNMEQTVHNFTDLESSYDSKVANMCGVVEEPVGVDIMAIELFTKVTSRFEHCIGTNFGIGEESYGSIGNPLGGLGQGIVILDWRNRCMCSFTFKALEEKGYLTSNVDSIALGKND